MTRLHWQLSGSSHHYVAFLRLNFGGLRRESKDFSHIGMSDGYCDEMLSLCIREEAIVK